MKKEELFRIFSHIPTLETERLLLRPLRATDSADMYEYARDAEVTRYLLWNPHADVGYTRRYLEYLSGRYRLGVCYEWAIVHRESGRMIGTCGFVSIDTVHNRAELGYVLNPKYRGTGLAPEAARRVIAFGFDVLHLNRIESRYMVENTSSRRVMEKIGMRFEGVYRGAMLVKGDYRDIGMCAILQKDYERNKP